MSRKEQLILQFIMWLAVGTFLFGIWAVVVGVRKSTPVQIQPSPSAATNSSPPRPTPR